MLLEKLQVKGIVKRLTFMPTSDLVKECSDVISLHCDASGYINVPKNTGDIVLELHSPGFTRLVDKPSFLVRLFTENGKLELENSLGWESSRIQKSLGFDDEEYAEFKVALYNDVATLCVSENIENKNFRIAVYRMGGIDKRVVFRPKSSISEYLKEVAIELDLSNYIDLENRPSKKGEKGEPIEKYLERERERMVAEGMDAETIEKNIEKLAVVPQYDVMLSLVYSTVGNQVLPLGMYTQNSDVKFFNGDEANLYQQDLMEVLGVPNQELKQFKKDLCNEVLDVLRELGIKQLFHSPDNLGLGEPWANTIGEVNMESIKKLQNPKAKAKAKTKAKPKAKPKAKATAAV